MSTYNKDNIFYKILNNELETDMVFENEFFIAIRDIKPKARIHCLIIPKKLYIDCDDFSKNASKDEKSDVFDTIEKITHIMGVQDSGYNIQNNCKPSHGQEILHFHIHLIAK